MPRKVLNPYAATKIIKVAKGEGMVRSKELYGNLALPSYVHGYSLGIQYMYNWFKSKFPENFFRGGIYIDGKNVLDDYKRLNEYSMKNIVKGENPRARMAPTVDYDYDREGLDVYQAPPEVYLRRSSYEDAFFKDYDRHLFLGFKPRMMRMNVAYKVRLNSRSQQLDTYNKMELDFRNGATQYEYISVDFHIPKYIVLNIADRAGFEIKDGAIVDIIDFLHYMNQHSDLPFLFKLRAINQQPEFFIRISNLYTHIAVLDKLSLDDGERDGKLDFNFHVEMNAVLEMIIPHYYSFYSAEPLTTDIMVREQEEGCVAVYSFNLYEIPKTNEIGWGQTAVVDYSADKGDTEIDISSVFGGDNAITRAIHHDLTVGISPSKYIDIKIYRDEDIAIMYPFKIDWNNYMIHLNFPTGNEMLHIAIYIDRDYINELDIEMRNLDTQRLSKQN